MKPQNIEIKEQEEGIFQVIATIGHATVQEYKTNALKKVHSQAKIKGFREGKAPLTLIEKTHEPQIKFETVNALFAPLLDFIQEEHKVTPMSTPHVEGFEEYQWGSDLSLTLIIENVPSVSNIPDLSSITIEKVEHTYKEDSILRQELEMLQQLHAHYHDIEDTTTDKDFVKATLSIKGEGIEREPESRYFSLKKEDPYYELTQVFMGKEIQKSYIETVTISDSFVDEELRGKTLTIEFTIENGKRVHSPDLNDEFAKMFNFDSLDLLKEAIKKAITKRVEIKDINKTSENIYLALAKVATFSINKTIVMSQTQNDLQSKLQMLISQQKTFDQFIQEKGLTEDNFMEAMALESRSNIEQFLITNELMKQHNIEVTNKEIDEFIEEIISMEFANQNEIKNYYKNNDKQLENLSDRLKLKKLAQLVIEKVNIKGSTKVPLEDLREGAI